MVRIIQARPDGFVAVLTSIRNGLEYAEALWVLDFLLLKILDAYPCC
jgi:hypothetical protein